jgi:DNA helicase-2/ATP-dependent DNA helicase PcrA
VVLLDEFQDTSHAQLVLLRALFGGGHPVTAVGDPCQSIYGWRGASAGNLARFAREFPAGARPATVTQLATSFRNTGRVLDVAGAIQRDLREQVAQVPRLVAPPGRAGRGAVVCALLETAAAEARWVGEQVAGLVSLRAGIAPDGGPWDRRRPAVRHRRALARAPSSRRRARDRGAGGPGRGGRAAGCSPFPGRHIVANLRVLHDLAASPRWVRLLTGPRWRIGPRDLALGRAPGIPPATRSTRPATARRETAASDPRPGSTTGPRRGLGDPG